MGWGGGTKIFDQVADDLLEADYQWHNIQEDGYDEFIVFKPLKNLYKVLCDLDWDNEYESKYWEHPIIGVILGNDELHDNWN